MSKNRMTGGGAAGGPGSRAMHAPTTYFTGHPGTKISPRGVSQIGSSMGNHSMDNAGKKLTKSVEPVRQGLVPIGGPHGVPLGVEVAASTVCGPGGSRSVSKSGSQHGLVTNPAPIGGKDILSEFGNDSPNVRGRR